MKKGRNDPCWCGSGKKFKRCHLGREKQPKPSVSASMKEFDDAHRRRICLHPTASLQECSGKIVRAHTVQETILRNIARNGHVYGFSTDLGAIFSSDGRPIPRLMGVGKASTFSGFCEKHDTSLFLPIEAKPVAANPLHACLLAYRALCRELYAKEGGEILEDHFRSVDRGRTLPEQVAMQREISKFLVGIKAGLRDMRDRKARYDAILESENFESVRYCVIWLDRIPDIMCSGGENPCWSFCGKPIQDLNDTNMLARGLAFALISSLKRGYAVFSWLAEEDDCCVPFVNSLIGLGEDQIPHALVRFIWSNFENQYWSPTWWESLPAKNQSSLVERFCIAVDPTIPISPDHLLDDGVRVVDWRVIGVESNMTA